MRISILTVTLLCSWWASCAPPQGSNAEQAADQPSAVRTMTGFNAEYMTDVCLDGTFTGNKLLDVRLHPDCASVVEDMDPEILRWPGGITAQYYHIDGTGYGFRPSEVKGTEYKGNAVRVQDLLDLNYIDIFCEIARGRKVIFVANLLYGTLEENLEAVRKLGECGTEVIGIELGNEFYFSKMSPETYLERCAPYIDSIRDIKLAVHLAPDFGAKNQNWNKTVSKADVAAYVIHEYNRKIKNDCAPGPDYLPCALRKTEAFSGKYIEFLLKTYSRKYGDREIWLTEWNIAPRTPEIYGTFVHAYHTFVMLNRLNELDIDIALFHNLVTGGTMYPVATRKKEKLTYNPDYFVHRMMPKGEYLGSRKLKGCALWIYADGIAVANTTGSAIDFTPEAIDAGFVLQDYEVLVAEDLSDRPVYAEGDLSGIVIPPYALAVLR